jgi:two-component system sensor histidine kinase BarA
VLVADDSAVNREVARAALARFGITAIVMVEDGQAALEASRLGGFDLVLMDGSMPVLDGYAAAAAIRSEEGLRGAGRLPIVALTAHVVGAAAEAWRAAGMDGTLTKPFTLRALGDTLLGFLTPGGASAEPDPASQDSASQDSVSEHRSAIGPSEDADLLDAEVVDGLVDMAERAGTGFAARILDLYAETAPAALAAIRAATEAEAVAKAAHGLRSMSLNIGGRALARALAEIEDAARMEGRLPTSEAVACLGPLVERTLARVGERLGIVGDVARDEGLRLSA